MLFHANDGVAVFIFVASAHVYSILPGIVPFAN